MSGDHLMELVLEDWARAHERDHGPLERGERRRVKKHVRANPRTRWIVGELRRCIADPATYKFMPYEEPK